MTTKSGKEMKYQIVNTKSLGWVKEESNVYKVYIIRFSFLLFFTVLEATQFYDVEEKLPANYNSDK